MKILFVCRGNVGRSRMGAAILKQMFPEYHIESAGTRVLGKDGTSRHGQVMNELEAAKNVILVMNELGVDVSEEKRIQLEEEYLKNNNFDRVTVMAEPDHIPAWLKDHPGFVYWEVEDPKGTDDVRHREIRDIIKSKIEENIGLFRV